MNEPSSVALFATCLVDLFRPEVGQAAIRLLREAGAEVVVPPAQTCCGQPGYNTGDLEGARLTARGLVELLEPYPTVVVPSGSCAGMLVHHYPRILADDPAWLPRARSLAQKTHELTAFLYEHGWTPELPATEAPVVAYHDACAGLRELGIREQPRALLQRAGWEVRELAGGATCCGFGGTFCLKFGAISAHVADARLADTQYTGAGTLTAGDLGCLLHLAGRSSRCGGATSCYHVAELLADGPAALPLQHVESDA